MSRTRGSKMVAWGSGRSIAHARPLRWPGKLGGAPRPRRRLPAAGFVSVAPALALVLTLWAALVLHVAANAARLG